jgi:hypothetical protein
VLEAVFALLEFSSPSRRRIFIGSHSPSLFGSLYRSFMRENEVGGGGGGERERLAGGGPVRERNQRLHKYISSNN